MYHYRLPCFLTLCTALLFTACSEQLTPVEEGIITTSTTFLPNTYRVTALPELDTSLITVTGNNIVLDFQDAIIDARNDSLTPDQFSGIAIRILDSRNVTIRNLSLHGFKIALYAENVDSLVLENCDFSYNNRQKLGSKWDREALSDWLYYHDNENDEWFRYGAGAYLKNCHQPLVRDLTVTQGQNGLMLVGCNDGLIYNNHIRFNSGLGIGMYRSSGNRIMHNRLDWNVRGYSHGKYARGQDSAGILLYEQCDSNTIAYNSATHSGDGLFLWAGNHTMDTGKGGCNDNIIYGNDFSHSVANGVEATFSSNIIVNNTLDDSRYGVWAGYSHHSLIADNRITGCDFGIAIEHGNHNLILNNKISHCDVGVQLWERASQPAGWGYAEKRDVRSRNEIIIDNVFDSVELAVELTRTDSIRISANDYRSVGKRLVEKQSNTNILSSFTDLATPYDGFTVPDRLPDGQDAMLPDDVLRGRQYIIVNKWGPYNFSYPLMVERSREQGLRRFAVFGPHGNWKLTNARGFTSVNPRSGSVPTTIEAGFPEDSTMLALQLMFIGTTFADQFGNTVQQGTPYPFGYNAFVPESKWKVQFYNYGKETNPLDVTDAMEKFARRRPDAELDTDQIAYRWWRAPHEDIHPDMFATIATTSVTLDPGNYLLTIESDDGIRCFVDGHLVLERWDVHTPTLDEVRVGLGGTHRIMLHHFDNGGLACLDFTITPVELQQ